MAYFCCFAAFYSVFRAYDAKPLISKVDVLSWVLRTDTTIVTITPLVGYLISRTR